MLEISVWNEKKGIGFADADDYFMPCFEKVLDKYKNDGSEVLKKISFCGVFQEIIILQEKLIRLVLREITAGYVIVSDELSEKLVIFLENCITI